MLGSLAGPLLLSFDKKVSFYRKWKYLFPAMIFPAALYIAWDIYFTDKNVWQFNAHYITGNYFFNLPVEEVMFFFIVPYCAVFIYECMRCYFPKLKDPRSIVAFTIILSLGLLVAGLIFHNEMYTVFTFVLTAVFMLLFILFKNKFPELHLTTFFISYAITLIPFLVVNGLLTALPVVQYNDQENLGIRIYTIPLEDVFYGMLLIFLNVLIFEWLRTRTKKA